jgi:hypothetical protein
MRMRTQVIDLGYRLKSKNRIRGLLRIGSPRL